MKKLINCFSYCICFLFNAFPDSVGKILAWTLAILWVDILKIRKDVVYSNIEIAFPNTDIITKKKWMRTSLFVLTKSLFDLFKIPFVDEKWINKNVCFHGFEELSKYQGGVFFLCLHMASGDLGAAAISFKQKPISLITKRFKNFFVDEFWFSIRRRSKTEFIDAHAKSNAFDILKALKAGRGVVFVLDQFMGKPYGIATHFFKKQTGTAYGLAVFAQKTKKPVLPMYSYWGADGKLNICLKPAIDLSDLISDDIDNNNRLITNRFNLELENIIKLHPEQWMWVHKRWKVFE